MIKLDKYFWKALGKLSLIGLRNLTLGIIGLVAWIGPVVWFQYCCHEDSILNFFETLALVFWPVIVSGTVAGICYVDVIAERHRPTRK